MKSTTPTVSPTVGHAAWDAALTGISEGEARQLAAEIHATPSWKVLNLAAWFDGTYRIVAQCAYDLHVIINRHGWNTTHQPEDGRCTRCRLH